MVYSSELGHHLDRCYHDQDGNFIVPEDASIVVQSSGYFRDESYESLTIATTSISRQGFTRLVSTGGADQWSLAAPAFPGVTKTIVSFSTGIQTIVSAVRINNSLACRVIKLTPVSTFTSTDPEMLPIGVELYGASTALWIMKGVSKSSTPEVVLSSAT